MQVEVQIMEPNLLGYFLESTGDALASDGDREGFL